MKRTFIQEKPDDLEKVLLTFIHMNFLGHSLIVLKSARKNSYG
jgi:hypothetical protein